LITVKISGGIGNQLFQYATGRSLANDLNSDLYLDLSYYSNFYLQKHSKYRLDNFDIKIDGYTHNLSCKVKKKIEKIKKEDETIFSDYGDTYGSDSTYKPQISDLKGNIYLEGYWQNEKYFIHNEKIIKDDLQLKSSPNKKNKNILKQLSSSVNSVALMVRRGDYLNPYLKAQFGFCTLSYYEKAIEKIAKEVENPIFYIFSDDPEWVKKNIKLSYPTHYISHNYKAEEDWEDIRLISSCKHIIMGNSSFSWWGAWLNKNKFKIAIGPEPWISSYTYEDIMPEHWTKIKYDNLIFDTLNNVIYKETKTELNNVKLKINPNTDSIKQHSNKKDHILRILVDAESPTLLKIHDENIHPILVKFERGISIRYIYLDNMINIYNIIINNESETKLRVVDLEIRSVKNTISEKYKIKTI